MFEKNSIFVLGILVIVIGCSSADRPAPIAEGSIKTTQKDAQIISVHVDEEAPVKMSTVFSDIRYLKLPAPGERLIGRIQKVIFEDNHIFILESGTPSIFIYTTDGSFVRQIKIPEGNGPGELTYITDMVVHPGGQQISVLGAYRINTYTFEGIVANEHILKVVARKMGLLPNGDYVLYMDNTTYTNGGNKNNLLYMTPKGNIYKQALPIPREKSNMGFLVPNNFPATDSTLLFYGFPSYNIYELGMDSIRVKYRLDFGEHAVPASLYEERTVFDNGIAFRKKIFEHGYASYIANFHETKNVIFLSFYTSNAPPRSLFYAKKTGKSLVATRLINDIDQGVASTSFQGIYHGELVHYVQPTDLINKAEKLRQQSSAEELRAYRQREQNLIDLTEGMSPMDNPVLMFCKVKESF